MSMLRGRWVLLLALLAGGLLMADASWAQDAEEAAAAVEEVVAEVEAAAEEAFSFDWETAEVSEEMFTVNNLWIMISDRKSVV